MYSMYIVHQSKYRWLSMYVTYMYYWVYVSVYACDCNHGVHMWVLWGKGGCVFKFVTYGSEDLAVLAISVVFY